MAKVSTNITIDAETKAKAQAMLADFGMDLSTAVNIFLKQMIYEGAIPFAISREVPNKAALATIQEAYEMKASLKNHQKHDSADTAVENI